MSRTLSRAEKVVTYVIGMLDEMVEAGTVDGGCYRLAPAGKANYRALKATGFEPTADEIRDAMDVLQGMPCEVDA